MVDEKTVIICLDAFKFDYLDKTIFLKKLSKKNHSGKLQTTIGFTSVEATLLTGKLPDQLGFWNEFYYNAADSPFKLIKFFRFFDGTIFEKPLRFLFEFIYNGLRLLSGHNYFFSIHAIPFDQIHKFDTSIKDSWVNSNLFKSASIFNQLDKKKIEYLCFDWPVVSNNRGFHIDILSPNKDESKIESLIKNIDRADVFWLHIWDLDSTTHAYGTKSYKTEEEILQVDALCEKLVNQISRKYKIKFLFWSDHGMCDIYKTIDLSELTENLNVTMFLDSCIARFWVEEEAGKKELLKRLNHFKDDGHLITDQEMKNYGINFSDKRQGDLTYICHPGVLIFPNYYNRTKPEKAMHGYMPRNKNMQGFYIMSGNSCKRENINISELHERLKKLLNLT